MLAMLRDLSALAPFSLLADAATVVGMLVVLADDVDNLWTSSSHDFVGSKGATALPFLFGVVIYCYEGIGMILPIEDAMRDKSKVRRRRRRRCCCCGCCSCSILTQHHACACALS